MILSIIHIKYFTFVISYIFYCNQEVNFVSETGQNQSKLLSLELQLMHMEKLKFQKRLNLRQELCLIMHKTITESMEHLLILCTK